MNLSPALYEEFALPYDQKLLEHFDGGIVHFCGRGDHYIPVLCRASKLYGINMSQPEYNDMEIIYRNTVDKGIPLLCFSPPVAQRDQHRPGGFHGHLQTL
jgi:uroporphyrinogen-III decarboxylase